MAAPRTPLALGDRLDRLPLSSFHRRLVLALAGMILFEWVEINAFAFVAPTLREQWGIPLSTVALVAGISQLGAFGGGVLGGYLADRVGRKRTLLLSVTVYSVGSGLCVLVQNPWQLIAARFVAHLGAQAMAVIAIVTLTEFVPAAARGRLQTWKVAIGALGIPIAAWTGYFVVPHWTWGWRLVLGLGLFGVVFAHLVHRWVPESPRWLLSQGEAERAEEVVRFIERSCGVEPPTPATVPPVPAAVPPGARAETTRTGAEPSGTDVEVSRAHPPAARVRFAELLAPRNRRRFAVVATMWVAGLFAYSAFNTWTPTFLSESGLDLDDTLLLSAAVASAAPLGAVLAVPLIDRWDRRRTQLVLGALTALSLLLFGLVHAPVPVLVLGALTSLLFQASVPFLQVYSAEVFPTRIRALGSGTSNALSRIVNFGAPMLVAAVYGGLGYTAVFAMLAVLGLVGGCVAVLFGPRTTGVSLEAAADTPHTPHAPNAPNSPEKNLKEDVLP
ncbi:MFS transporter [Streptomyces sp. NPDC053780]|uniref:MFS transporter n=1 Tax=unclassified Streptomyces TaxID=2593676 RepID=UPI003440D1D3